MYRKREINVCVYIYIYREREREILADFPLAESGGAPSGSVVDGLHIYIYIYIYTYTYIYTHTHIHPSIHP